MAKGDNILFRYWGKVVIGGPPDAEQRVRQQLARIVYSGLSQCQYLARTHFPSEWSDRISKNKGFVYQIVQPPIIEGPHTYRYERRKDKLGRSTYWDMQTKKRLKKAEGARLWDEERIQRYLPGGKPTRPFLRIIALNVHYQNEGYPWKWWIKIRNNVVDLALMGQPVSGGLKSDG